MLFMSKYLCESNVVFPVDPFILFPLYERLH